MGHTYPTSLSLRFLTCEIDPQRVVMRHNVKDCGTKNQAFSKYSINIFYYYVY